MPGGALEKNPSMELAATTPFRVTVSPSFCPLRMFWMPLGVGGPRKRSQHIYLSCMAFSSGKEYCRRKYLALLEEMRVGFINDIGGHAPNW